MASHSAQSLEQRRLQLVPGGVNGRRPRVVIVGAGFAGLTVAKRLAQVAVDVTLSTGRTVTSFSRCCTKWRRPDCRQPTSRGPFEVCSRARIEFHLRALEGQHASKEKPDQGVLSTWWKQIEQ